MGIIDWLGAGKDLAEPIKAVGDLYTTDKARLEAEAQLRDVVQKPQLAQMATNSILASSSKLFISGWQPLLGWSCGLLVLLYYAPQIVISTCLWYEQCSSSGKVLPFPMKPDDLLNLVYLLFGFGVHSIATKK